MNAQNMDAIETPLEYVGFRLRFVASIIDSILLMMIIYPLLTMIYGSEYGDSKQMLLGIPDLLISWVFPIVATIVFWVSKSATPGKMAVRAKIVDAQTGNLPSVKQSIIRYIGYYISLLPLGLGYLWIVWDSKKQAWHDKLAGTVVVRPISQDVENVSFSAEKNKSSD